MNKQKNISVEQNCKENTSGISHGDALRGFYNRLTATQGPDHPHMLELAGIIAAHEDAEHCDSKVDNINHAVEILDDLLLLARDAVAQLGSPGDKVESAIVAARRFVGDIREVNNQPVGVAA